LIKLVLDSNVILSGIVFGGKPRQILRHVIEGDVELYLSREILNEVLEVLQRKFDYPQAQLLAIENECIHISTMIEPDLRLDIVEDDEDDNRILECAVASGCGFIISGDHHLLSLRSYQGIEILGVTEFLARI